MVLFVLEFLLIHVYNRVLSKEVRVVEQKLVLLVPSPGPLPSRNLLVGSIKWME